MPTTPKKPTASQTSQVTQASPDQNAPQTSQGSQTQQASQGSQVPQTPQVSQGSQVPQSSQGSQVPQAPQTSQEPQAPQRSQAQKHPQKNSSRKVIGLKDLVLCILLSCLILVIFFVWTSISNLILMDFWLASLSSIALPALVSGTIFFLMAAKSPRIGTAFILFAVGGTFMLVAGTLATALILYAMGIVGELTMIGGWGKKWRPVIPYILFWLTSSYAATVQLIFSRQLVVDTYMGFGMDAATAESTVDAIAAIYTLPLNMIVVGVIAVVCSIAGYALGARIFGKRFKAAGVA